MRVAIYARVSTEAQEARGTIASQLQVLRERVTAEGHECVGEFVDDGCSGARLDRPGLDGLRDAAEAGLIEAVWCLSPDRLARVYAYQVLVLDELARWGVPVRFSDAPPLDDDPEARLLTQVQGVIAEYERAKIAERARRGKLYRAKSGEVISWKPPYGYHRVPRGPDGLAHLVVDDAQAAVVRRIFADYVGSGASVRGIARQLNDEGVSTPLGKGRWGSATVCRVLRNEAYVGRLYYNQTQCVPDPRPGRRSREVPRPREEWVALSCPAIVAEEIFDAAQRVSRDNSAFSQRRAEPGAWLLRGLVRCGPCGVKCGCSGKRSQGGERNALRYYDCRYHSLAEAGGRDRQCRERRIRADALDSFVFDQVRGALLSPDVLLAGETALAASRPAPDDELLAAELARLERKLAAADGERRRLVDLYQTGLVELVELQRRAKEIESRRRQLDEGRANLEAQRQELVTDNRLRQRVEDFASCAHAALDGLDFDQRQQLLRLVVEDVRVTGWHVEIRLRIPLDDPSPDRPTLAPAPRRRGPQRLSSDDGLRSLHLDPGAPPPAQLAIKRRTDGSARPETTQQVGDRGP